MGNAGAQNSCCQKCVSEESKQKGGLKKYQTNNSSELVTSKKTSQIEQKAYVQQETQKQSNGGKEINETCEVFTETENIITMNDPQTHDQLKFRNVHQVRTFKVNVSTTYLRQSEAIDKEASQNDLDHQKDVESIQQTKLEFRKETSFVPEAEDEPSNLNLQVSDPQIISQSLEQSQFISFEKQQSMKKSLYPASVKSVHVGQSILIFMNKIFETDNYRFSQSQSQGKRPISSLHLEKQSSARSKSPTKGILKYKSQVNEQKLKVKFNLPISQTAPKGQQKYFR